MNIEDLISQYIDGELSSEAEAELHHRLSVSPEDRTLFREHIALRDAARSRQLQHQPSRAMEMALFARLAAEQEAELPEPEVAEPAMERAMEPAAALRPLEPIAAAPAMRSSMAADAGPVRSGQAPARPAKRRRLLPMLVPFVIGVAAMGLLWKLYSGSVDQAQIASTNGKDTVLIAAKAPAATGSSEGTIAADGMEETRSPEATASSPLGGSDVMSDAGPSSYNRSYSEPSRPKSGNGGGSGARSSGRAVGSLGEGGAMGSGTAAREEASEDFATMSNPAAPPPPPAVSETQSRDSRVLNQSYDSDSRRGRAVSPPRQTAVPEEVQSARSDDRNATSTPIMPPQQQIQSEVKEKSMAALDSQDQAPRQYADAPKDQDGSYRQQPANALGKRNGKPTVATPPPAGTITQLGDAYFDPDRATLKESSQQSLDYLVDLMNSYPDMRVEIQGHTDGDGSDDRNYLLSESRARSVKEYLRRKGIAPARMEIQGFGPAEPLAPNTTAVGKKLNRRVVVKVKDYSYSNSGTLRK